MMRLREIFERGKKQDLTPIKGWHYGERPPKEV